MAWSLTAMIILFVLVIDNKMLKKISVKERRTYLLILLLFIIANVVELNNVHVQNPVEWIYHNVPFIETFYSFLENRG